MSYKWVPSLKYLSSLYAFEIKLHVCEEQRSYYSWFTSEELKYEDRQRSRYKNIWIPRRDSFHRIVELFGLEGTLKITQFQPLYCDLIWHFMTEMVDLLDTNPIISFNFSLSAHHWLLGADWSRTTLQTSSVDDTTSLWAWHSKTGELLNVHIPYEKNIEGN